MTQPFPKITALLIGLCAQNLAAQALIDMTMVNFPANSDKLEVRIRTTETVTNGLYSSGIFTVRYPTAMGGTLSVFSQNYNYTIAGAPSNSGGFTYYRLQFVQNYTVNWNACQEYIAVTLKYSGGPANGAFELITGVPWTNMNNGNFYQELEGEEREGLFYGYKTTVTNVPCHGSSNGAIDLVISGGRPAFTYAWSNNATTQDIGNLAAGTYTVTITDNVGCTKSVVSTVTEPATLSLSIPGITNSSCGNANGAIDLDVTGGTSPYSYDWSNNGPQNPDSDPQDLSGLSVGTYTVTVTDGNTCSSTISASISESSGMALSSVVTNASCGGGNNGAIDLSVSGGTSPYSYDWSNNGPQDPDTDPQDLLNLAAGTYTVTVTDASACTATLSATVAGTSLSLSISVQTNVTCNGGSNGSATVSLTGGTGPYTFDWTGSPTGDGTSTITGLVAGTYTVTVTDAVNCSATISTTITQPAALALTETHLNVLCNGNSTGSVDLTVTGGTGAYTYSWTGGSTAQDRSGLAAGTYTVTVTDANSCTKTLSVSITEPAALSLSKTQVNVLCNGGSTGSIDLSVSGGISPYSYLWTGGATTQDRSGIPAGTFTVTVTDANACTKTLSAIITQPSAIVLTETHMNILCNGNATGSIDLSVAGGIGPYTYNWGGGITTQDRLMLVAGTYTVTVTDANACTKTLSSVITHPPALALSATQTDVACNGNASGSIDLTVSGGSGLYTYSWTGGATTQDIAGLVAGVYTVTVMDANACSKTLSASITQPSALLLTEVHVNVLCNGNLTGSIDLGVSGGTGAYTYNWGGGGTTQDRLNLGAGTYTVTVTDANGCSKTLSAAITSPAALSLSATRVNSTCGSANGSIDLSVSGGTGGYTYNWGGGITTQDRTNVPAGTYTVTVTDANACTQTLSATVNNTNGPNLSTTQTNVLCNGNSTGSIDLSVTGGTGPYTYNWGGGVTTQDRMNLSAGTYTVTVTDANSCTKTISATVTEPAALTPSATSVNATCGNANGSIDLSVSGGTGPYTYNWGGGITTQDRTNVSVGTYIVTVTDANGCTKTLSATVNNTNGPTLTASQENVLCNGSLIGSIDLSVSGGTGPYTYNWGGGITTQDRMNLGAGTYTVTVTDANGCSKTLSATITSPAALSLSATSVNSTCGSANGSIDLSVSGGTGGYTYNWGGGVTTQDRTNVPAGTYTVTVTDANSCTKTLSATVNNTNGPTLTASQVNVLCNGNLTGSINLSVSGGTGPYTYNWGGGVTTQDRMNLGAGTYTVTVTDANGCSKTLSASITSPAALSLSANSVNSTCGSANGSIDLSVSGGTGGYTYNWGGGITTQDRTNVSAGTYTVTVTDANGCTKTLSVAVNNTNGPTLTASQVNVLCNGSLTGSIDLSVSGGTGPYTYNWGGGITTQDRLNLGAGTYTVTVTDANGCTKTLSASISSPPALLLTETHTNILCSVNSSGSIDLSVSGGTGGYTYNWGGGVTSQDRTNLNTGTYTVTVTDANGCTKTLSTTIQVLGGPSLTETHVNVHCSFNATGSIDLSVSNGSGPYTYNWGGGVTTQDLANLTAGTYTVTVTDANNCSKTLSISIGALDNAAPVLTASAIATCYPNIAAAQAAAIAGTTITDDYDSYGNLIIQAITTGACPATVTLTVTDQCGHSSSIAYPGLCIGPASEVNITTEASDGTSACEMQASALQSWLNNHGTAVASGTNLVWTHTAPVFTLNCSMHSRLATVVFRATNDCGNYDETTAKFIVTDLTLPTANPIPGTNMSCNAGIPLPDVNLVTGETDNCGGTPSVALYAVSDDNASGCPGTPRTIIHQYIVTDDYCNTALVNHVISVVDNVPPNFTAPPNITIQLGADCMYSALPPITGDVSDESDNCSPSGPGLQAYYLSDEISPGVNHPDKYIIKRTWRLSDGCGNQAVPRVQTITVQDTMKPLLSGCAPNLSHQGEPLVIENVQYPCAWIASGWAEPFFSDNCPGSVLSYHLDGFFIGAADGSGTVNGVVFLEGETKVTYTVVDQAGNTASCMSLVTINCLTISGRIIWEHDKLSGVKNATVKLSQIAPPLPLSSDLSDSNGNYDLAIPSAGTYRITPVKNTGGNAGRMNGVDAADASRILQHVNYSQPIVDPYKKVCADVNRSGIINTQDAMLITQCIAGNPTAQAVFNVFWRFAPKDFAMPGTAHQEVPVFPAFKDVPIGSLDVPNVHFYGMKIGDVAAPWANPQNIATPAPLVWVVQDQTLVAGTEISLSFAASNFTDLASYQFGLDFDPSQLQFVGFQTLGAIPLNLTDHFGTYNASLGDLRSVWAVGTGTSLPDGTPVFKAIFKVLESGQKLSDVLLLDDSQIECKAFTASFIPLEIKLLFAETLEANSPSGEAIPQLRLLQNRPNPFSEATTIGFILPAEGDTRIRILDWNGRELTSYDRYYTAGYHEIEFRATNAACYDLVFCELITPQGTKTIRMLVSK